MACHVSGLLEARSRPALLPARHFPPAPLGAMGAPRRPRYSLNCARIPSPEIVCARPAYFSGGAWMLLLSIVTASRAKALPDRLAAVFIVMLE
jgi:hypothetical protein